MVEPDVVRWLTGVCYDDCGKRGVVWVGVEGRSLPEGIGHSGIDEGRRGGTTFGSCLLLIVSRVLDSGESVINRFDRVGRRYSNGPSPQSIRVNPSAEPHFRNISSVIAMEAFINPSYPIVRNA